MIITKFGGTSVSTAKNIKTIGEITQREIKRQPVIVVSALSGVTDLFLSVLAGKEQKGFLDQIKEKHISLANELWSGKCPQEIILYIDTCLLEVKKLLASKINASEKNDAVLSHGEKMSSYLMSKALISFGINAKQVIATELIVTDNDFGSADFLEKLTQRKVTKVLIPLLQKGIVPVITGFIGSTIDGKIATLGRGGSDYSASIIGFCLKAQEVQIWTDVDGILTTDPRIIKNSYRINKVSYREAAELATFGAKVLHPRTIHPAQKAGIPVRVLNTMNPDNKGTLIEVISGNKPRIAAISAKKNITLINIYSTEMLLKRGFLSYIFSVFAKYAISVDLVSVSEVSVSVTLDNKGELPQALRELRKIATVTEADVCGIVSIIGEQIVGVSKIMERIFAALDKNTIVPKMISFGATDINISLVFDSSKVEKAVKCLHDALLVQK